MRIIKLFIEIKMLSKQTNLKKKFELTIIFGLIYLTLKIILKEEKNAYKFASKGKVFHSTEEMKHFRIRKKKLFSLS